MNHSFEMTSNSFISALIDEPRIAHVPSLSPPSLENLSCAVDTKRIVNKMISDY